MLIYNNNHNYTEHYNYIINLHKWPFIIIVKLQYSTKQITIKFKSHLQLFYNGNNDNNFNLHNAKLLYKYKFIYSTVTWWRRRRRIRVIFFSNDHYRFSSPSCALNGLYVRNSRVFLELKESSTDESHEN